MTNVPPPPSTLIEAFERAVVDRPDRGIAIFDRSGRRFQRYTYPELWQRARSTAARWHQLGVEPGDRVLVSQSTSWEWMDAWLGVLLCGGLPVALAPGGMLGGDRAHLERFDRIAEQLDAKFVAMSAGTREAVERQGLERLAARAMTSEELSSMATTAMELERPEPDDVAFLQLTSGSTGLPNAVAISHRSAVHNPWASDVAIGKPFDKLARDLTDSVVSWLPLHHDMGLVGCLFFSVVMQVDLWLLRPTTFLARPRQWLKQLGSRGRTLSPAPNFGYQLCVERGHKGRDELDLSGWFAALTGAEMVRPETIDSFVERFAADGFERAALRPCYGLAETTLAVTFDQRGEGPRTLPVAGSDADGFGLSEVVCVGEPVIDTELRIVAADGSPRADGKIGEVLVRGPGVFAGYFGNQDATDASLRNGWLHTGDLGFIDHGELYLTGRLKDLLIVRGENLMPHEIEWLADSVTGGGGTARSGAFSVARSAAGEEAVVVVETGVREADRWASMGREIRERVGTELQLTLADVAFVRRGQIPKTTSGKVQRRQLREAYLRGDLERLE